MKPASARLLGALGDLRPQTAVVLGSGLGGLVDAVDNPVRLAFGELEGFPPSGVSGHAGEIVAGTIGGVAVVLLSGRVHYYEHGNPAAMRLPLEVLKEAGIRNLVLTNSAGSLRDDMPPGSVMMINDHINWSGLNPLIGEPSDARFVGMTSAYHSGMMQAVRRSADASGTMLHEGVYMWFSGPSFETPAEIRMARMLGADAVGMSTVPEVILGRFLGLDCVAFSVITNFGAGMTGGELSHGETKEMAPMGGKILGALIAASLQEISQ